MAFQGTLTQWRMNKRGLAAVFIVNGLLCATSALADTYRLPSDGEGVVGAIAVTSSEYEDTISDIAYVYDQGFNEMRLANPKVDSWLPGTDTEIIVPSQFVLPETPREGIVINVPEMRLYYYPKTSLGESPVVVTHPLSVGRQDWRTPVGLTQIASKVKDPAWHPPETIQKEHAAEGDILPEVVPPGPDNPLGQFALRLGREGYLLHGTNKPYGIGMRVTHGCLRLYPKDIEKLFGMVAVGTPVRIVNQPFKLGWLGGVLYLEVHPYLDEDAASVPDNFTELVGRITTMAQAAGQTVDWDFLQKVISEKTGIPTAVSTVKPAGSPQTDLLTNNEAEAIEPELLNKPGAATPEGY
jgi:L,D-transpeptidase ErfK/SrfK